jgi:hypothetical protein
MALLFSVTIEDCTVQTFRAGGKGGQHQNKTESGVRVIHTPSGAVGEGRDSRSQLTNKRSAFLRMAKSKEFTNWHRIETARRLGQPSIESIVESSMSPDNLKIEFNSSTGWVEDNNA